MVPLTVAEKIDGRKKATIRAWAKAGQIRAEKRRVGDRDIWFVDLATFPPRRPLRKPDGVCLRCNQERKIANRARMLCGTCVTNATRNGELEDYPILRSRKATRTEVILEEFPRMRKFLGYHGAIERLAMVYRIDPLSVQKIVGTYFPASEFKEAE